MGSLSAALLWLAAAAVALGALLGVVPPLSWIVAAVLLILGFGLLPGGYHDA